MGSVRGGGHIGGIEKLRGAQRDAGAERAVADAEDLILAVDIRYLMHIAVFLGTLEHGENLLACGVVADAGLDGVARGIADGDAAVILHLAAAVAEHSVHRAAGAFAQGVKAVVLIQPVGYVLKAR